ncbi:hypothetical protein HYV11_03565 [Candidatus Dependentiae bacterium]|nr:hypothetical protein [Candidatus Dependentiae bacterium]
MTNKKFSLYDAYNFGFKTVINHFGFFFFSIMLISIAGVIVLSILGFTDYLAFREDFEMVFKTVINAMKSATGIAHVAQHNFSSYIHSYLPSTFSEAFSPKEIISLDLSKDEIIALFKILLPIIIGFKLFLDVVSIGWTKIALDLQANKSVEYDYIYKFFYLVPRVFLVNLFVLVITLLGLLLFIFPGIYVYQRLRFSKYFIIDKNLSIAQSLENSWKTTEGSVLHLCAYSVFAAFIKGMGSIFFPSLFFFVPLEFQVDANIYRQIIK